MEYNKDCITLRDTIINGNNDYVSEPTRLLNAKIIGKANPKTKIAPVIAEPIADLDYWKTNNFIKHSHINESSVVDLSGSGYLVQEPEPSVFITNKEIIEEYTDIIQPINSLIGISYTKDNTGEEPKKCVLEPITIKEGNVYDPRFYGYSSGDRGYVDKMTGSAKYYYDDIDSVKMPNYITRNNIDTQPFGDTYSSLNSTNMNGNPFNRDIRVLAQESFINNTEEHRNSIMESAMRKCNERRNQEKHHPKLGVYLR